MDEPQHDGPVSVELGAEYIRARLDTLKRQIEDVGHGATLGFWVGDRATERRQIDDLGAGRVEWETAHMNAKRGIAAMDAGDFTAAVLYLLEAQAHAINALGIRLRPDDLRQLAKPAKPRGRPAGTNRPGGTKN